ncbi:hypothetical protein [Pleomorphomonas sp. NRK KF1]|uniref:hypothetical protein n=1 Tax=Pleomorphomonas sp. NRK KF1 TaxID=2943000 RepID=UPI0020448782|nr:hypothetical protein [Pleomorphomonas sp. NRK KF1]MCM5555683.1 hypothetical protein [Pleomorphomonas sp. NRK KF1]
MNTKFLLTAALAAALVPSVASAAGVTFDPAARDNEPQFVDTFFNDGGVNAAAARADAARYAAAEEALKSGALIATHGSETARLVTTFNPAADDNEPQFKNTVVIENPANAAAARADAARYAAAEQNLESGALFSTHGSEGARVMTYYDPGADDNEPQFKNVVVFPN